VRHLQWRSIADGMAVMDGTVILDGMAVDGVVDGGPVSPLVSAPV
jgi:hypothetical protein